MPFSETALQGLSVIGTIGGAAVAAYVVARAKGKRDSRQVTESLESHLGYSGGLRAQLQGMEGTIADLAREQALSGKTLAELKGVYMGQKLVCEEKHKSLSAWLERDSHDLNQLGAKVDAHIDKQRSNGTS